MACGMDHLIPGGGMTIFFGVWLFLNFFREGYSLMHRASQKIVSFKLEMLHAKLFSFQCGLSVSHYDTKEQILCKYNLLYSFEQVEKYSWSWCGSVFVLRRHCFYQKCIALSFCSTSDLNDWSWKSVTILFTKFRCS